MTDTSILLAHDDSLFLESAREALDRAGFDVIVARDGLEGAAFFERAASRVSTLVSALQLPGLNGIQLAALAKSLKPELHVIYIDGSSPSPETSGRSADFPSRTLPGDATGESLVRAIRDVAGPAA